MARALPGRRTSLVAALVCRFQGSCGLLAAEAAGARYAVLSIRGILAPAESGQPKGPLP